MNYRALVPCLAILSICCSPLVSEAAGFRIYLDTVTDLGNAYAGGAALTQDASINAFNPAGLSFVHKNQIVANGIRVWSETTFTGTTTAPALLPFVGIPFAGSGKVSSPSNGIIPSIYYNYPINSQWDFGISANTPFGLGLDYKDDSILRYALVKANQKSINIAPSLSYLVNPHFSVGLGPDFQRYSLSAVVKQNTTSVIPSTDSTSKVWGSSWGYGGHAGVLYKPDDLTQIGVSYHSQMVHEVSGKSEFTSGIPILPSNSTNNFRLKFTEPANMMLSASRVLTPTWSVLGTVDYTFWDAFRYVTTYNVAQGAGVPPLTLATAEKFRNTWHAALAANNQLNQNWLLRFGAGYDQMATQTQFRQVQFPNGNVVALAIGTRYQPNSTVAFDAGYMHLFISSATIRYTDPVTGATQDGKTKTTGDVFGLDVVWNIC